MYAALDRRVCGMVLLNPWVRTDNGLARTTLRHYYRQRLADRAFWGSLLHGRFNYAGSIKSMFGLVRTAVAPSATAGATLPDRMLAGMTTFEGRIMVITGGADLTGREFCDMAAGTSEWQQLLASSRVTHHCLEGADHTFSRNAWRDQVATWTSGWVRSW